MTIMISIISSAIDFQNKTESLDTTLYTEGKSGEFFTKEHSGSSLDGKLQSSTDLVECLLTLGNAEIVEPQNQILVEKSSEEPDQTLLKDLCQTLT